MTKLIFPSYAESCLTSAAPNLSSVDVKIAAIDDSLGDLDPAWTAYDDISSAVIANTGNLGTKTVDDGTFDAANPSLGFPTGGDEIVALIAYHDTGTPSTSSLIAGTDEDAAGSPISILTDGNEILLDLNALGLFRLGT